LIRAFRQVTFPRLLPAIIAAALLSFTISFDDFVLPAFTNGNHEHVVDRPVLIGPVRHHPAANALATIMLAFTIGAALVTGWVLRRSRVQATPVTERTPRLRSLRRRPVQVG
jgi:spermidine/putrescine transport system permease protein